MEEKHLVCVTKKCRQYLHGYKFRVDHAALQWLATASFENSKLEHWAMRLQEFDYEIEYLPGDQSVVADHLSRHYSHMEAGSVTALAVHLAFATKGRVLDIEESGHDFMDPQSWCINSLRELCVTRRKLQTPGNGEEHKRQGTPTINPIGPTNKQHRPSTKHHRKDSPGDA